MVDHRYYISGLRLSSQEPLDRLDQYTGRLSRPWTLSKQRRPFPRSIREMRRQFCCKRLGDGSWLITWPREGAFWLDPKRRRVEYVLAPRVGRDAFQDMFLGPVVSYLLLLDGYDPLHGAAVQVGNEAVVFLGQSGSGKSTVATTFVLSGYGLIVDDVLSITWKRNRPCAIPGYPEIRLWPASGKALLSEFPSLSRVIPTSSKRRLDPRARAGGFVNRAVPLSVCYEVRRTTKDVPPTIEPLSGREAFVTLMRNLYNTALLVPESRHRQFDQMSKLASKIQVRRLLLPRSIARLRELPQLIQADVSRLQLQRRST